MKYPSWHLNLDSFFEYILHFVFSQTFPRLEEATAYSVGILRLRNHLEDVSQFYYICHAFILLFQQQNDWKSCTIICILIKYGHFNYECLRKSREEDNMQSWEFVFLLKKTTLPVKWSLTANRSKLVQGKEKKMNETLKNRA